MNDNVSPRPGHNQGPLLPPEALKADLMERHTSLFSRKAELLEAAATWPATIDTSDPERAEEQAKDINDLIKQLASLRKAAEATRVGEKEPFLERERIVDGVFKQIIEPIDKGALPLTKARDGYLRWKRDEEQRRRDAEAARLRAEAAEKARKVQEEERQRREAEEKARQEAARKAQEAFQNPNLPEEPPAPIAPAAPSAAQREAEEAQALARKAEQAAQAKPGEMARTRGSMGALGTLTRRWVGEMNSRADLDLEALRPYLAEDELNKAVRAWMRAHPGRTELRGAWIRQEDDGRTV